MPMVRYEIRNEHSLADPELYRAADKDDPEALLEGVAMAGLVGVLRQLGDLAEFAAEIFHNLHEEVMATAARGHGLMIRVQQLETEVPSIERAFLSQTDHSSFFYHPGVDWHPNLQVDQNPVTQRDLPRFIMDSYEECRAPPRLFLLDKFDVAGAGACLKRYTDPSFFKVETFGMATADVQREKKIRKAKKKGPRWRNGETPEVQPTSHAKLHQLFLEERVENGVGNPSRRAQLKRRLNGFPFDSKPGKSYMEKLLKSPSPDHKVLHEVTLNSSPLMLATNDHNKSGLEILEVRPVSPDRESEARKRSPPSSPERDESMLNPSIYEISEVPVDDKISELPNSYPSVGTDSISSTKVTGEKVIAVDAESNGHGMLTGEHSDGIASEVDNYVDAPSTMESEMDADSEFRVKSDFTSSHNKNQPLVSDANEEHFRTSSSESQSTGDSTISDEGNNSSRKETYCSSSSDSPGTSAENPQSEEISAKGFLSAGITEIEIVDTSSCEKNAGEDFPVDQHSKPVVPDDTCPGTDAITNKKSDSEQQAYCLCSNQSIYTALSSDSIVVGKGISKGPESDEIASPLDDREQKKNLAIDPPCSPTVSDFESHSGDDSPRSPAGELVDEPNGEIVPDISTVPGIHSYTTDSSVAISSDLRHEDESDQEHQNLGEDIASSLNKSNALSVNTNGTPDMISSDLIQGKPDDEFPKLTEGFPSDYPDTAHNGHNIKSAVHDGEHLIDELDNENLNVSSNAPNCIPSNTEDFLGRKLEETSPVDAQTVDAEDTRSNSSIENQISSENAILSHLANFLDWPQAGSDAHEGDVIPEVTTVNETLPLGTSRTCEVVNLQGTGIIGGISPNDSEALGRSLPTPEDLEEPQGTSDTVEKDGITPCTNSTGQEVPERSDSANPESVNEVHVLLDESQSEADKSHTADMASAVPAVPENAIVDNVLDKLAEENIHCFEDSGLDELENDKNDISGSHRQASLVEQVSQTTDATSDLKTVFCNTTYDDYPKSEVSETAPNSHLDFEVDCRLEFVHAAAIQPLMEQSGHDTDEEVFQQSGHVADAQDLPVAYEAEESIVQEKIGLPPSQLDQEIPLSGEISSELSPSLPTNHQQMPDRDDCKGDNNSASTFSLVNCQGPPSVSDISRLSNYGLNVPGYPKDPLGSILPPSNPFSGTADQINMDDLPPLPPLPPVQWRMGKLQHASSSAEGEMTKHEELFPQLISLPTASTNDGSSSPPSASADAVPSSPTTSTNEASLLLEEAKPSPVQIARETPSEEKVESSCSSLTASIIPETASKEEKAENICYSSESGILPENISKEEKVENSCSSLTASIIPETASKEEKAENICYSLESGILPETISKEEKVENSCSSLESGIIPVTISKEEKVENSSSTREANETVDLPPKIENEQQRQQFVMPTSESEFASPAEEDGVTNGNRTVKLPRPRNPLVDDVAALDKSKLRKVTERVRPQIQKVDERDSLLEQIRTKSFNLKPAMASRPSIRGPNTNLRVAAILEKANAIRQAFAGSDEDDDDCWSDS